MKLILAGVGAFVLQALLAASAGGQSDLLYDTLAQRWLERNGETEAKDWKGLLERRFAHVQLGLFDVDLPPSALADKAELQELATALQALLDTQRGWQAWVAGTKLDRRKDDDVITRWLRALGSKSIDAKNAAGADLLALSAADASVRTALEDLRTVLRAGPALGAMRGLEGVALALFPKRGEFVEFTCVTGALDPQMKPLAWNEGVASWMEFQPYQTHLVSLQYTAGGNYDKGVSVGERNPAALSELVAQVAARALQESVFATGVDPAFTGGVANALVIELYGELDTRIDGDVRARSSQGTSRFVPGGNPNGGVLPATSAENRWRGTKGKDFFVGILAAVQKQSAKRGETHAEKLACFELASDSGDKLELVHAPFLGPGGIAPSAEFLPDYLELVRCYGAAFLHWLRLEGAGKSEDSAARFSELLRTLGKGVERDDLPRVFEQVYHQPLSAPNVEGLFESATLEGRFLTWLSHRS